MLFKQFWESVNKKLIVVDVQPAYSSNIHFMDRFANLLESYSDILILYNGPDLGYPSNRDIANWYLKNGVPRQTIMRMKWFEKNYAFFRDLMDYGWDEGDIVKVVRFLLANKIWDWRQLSDEQIGKISKRLGIELNRNFIEGHFTGIPDLAFIIKRWNGADVIGGGCNECLKEVLILLNAFKMNYKVVNDFVY